MEKQQFFFKVCYVLMFCVFRDVLSVCLCTGYFVVVPLNLQHFFFNHFLNFYYDMQTGRVAHPLPPRGGGVQEIPEDSCRPRQQNHSSGNPWSQWVILLYLHSNCMSYEDLI